MIKEVWRMAVDGFLTTYLDRVIKPSGDKILHALNQPDCQRFMFSVEYIHIHEFVLHVLDTLMNIRGWRGILISIDKPANYIFKTMQHRNLNLERIHIIDIMTALTNENVKFPQCVVQLRSPFCADLDKDLLSVLDGPMALEAGIDLKKTHFIMFDNIAVLDHYIELLSLKRIFVKLEEDLKKFPALKRIMIMDKTRQLKIYEAFDGWADKEVVL
jgi:hypothetical protein